MLDQIKTYGKTASNFLINKCKNPSNAIAIGYIFGITSTLLLENHVYNILIKQELLDTLTLIQSKENEVIENNSKNVKSKKSQWKILEKLRENL